ncbi:MAG: GlmU family protein [Bernardetiaceae bacterium]
MLVFFDLPNAHQALLPLTFTRPLAELRVGILTIAEKWQAHLRLSQTAYLTKTWLAHAYPKPEDKTPLLYINGAICPNPELLQAIQGLPLGHALIDDAQNILALHEKATFDDPLDLCDWVLERAQVHLFEPPYTKLERPADIFLHNRAELIRDFQQLTHGRKSTPIEDPHTAIYAPEQVFVEEGARIYAAVLNAQTGPIYIGKNAEIQEGSVIRGAFAMGEGAVLNMGSKLRGDTTIGPYCKVGGEVSNSVLMRYSNKGHEGFLGNSVLGEWCNLGADTNTSNLKNNYSAIKVWDYVREDFAPTGLTFHGLVMGDHAKCGINTMFNTGTMVGVGANVFGGGFPPKFIPSFSWGGSHGLQAFDLDKFFEMAARMMQRRGQPLTGNTRRILTAVYEQTTRYRG